MKHLNSENWVKTIMRFENEKDTESDFPLKTIFKIFHQY